MDNEKRYLMLFKATGETIFFGCMDSAGVVFAENGKTKEYDNLSVAVLETGAWRFELCCAMLEIPSEMMPEKVIDGLTREELAVYRLLKGTDGYISTEMIIEVLNLQLGKRKSLDACYKTLERLAKRLPKTEYIESQRGRGYRICKDN